MKLKRRSNINLKHFTLNFGPQHPAAHGVLRLIVHLKSESITSIDTHIGLLHRGTEKLIEQKHFLQNLPYFDRLDYVSTLAQEHVYCLTLEDLFQKKLIKHTSFLRVICLELTRILNHLMAITTHALDLGALTPFLWAFESREKIMCFFEELCGARLHMNLFRPFSSGFLKHTFDGFENLEKTSNFLKKIFFFLKNFEKILNDIEIVLNNNFIWKNRLINIGKVNKDFAKNFAFSGIMVRSVGIPFDLRDSEPYEIYDKLNWTLICSKQGDCFDRYLLRLWEMRISIMIIRKCINQIHSNEIDTRQNYWMSSVYNFYYFPKIFIKKFLSDKKQKDFWDQLNKLLIVSKRKERYLNSMKKLKFSSRNHLNTMEKLIDHFKYWTFGFYSKYPISNYTAIEAPKGELGINAIIQKNNDHRLYRCKIRTPGYYHLQSINFMVKDLMLGDLIAIIGTQDIVFGEIDR